MDISSKNTTTSQPLETFLKYHRDSIIESFNEKQKFRNQFTISSLYIFLEACLVLTLKWSMYSSQSWVHIISGLLLYLLLQVLHRKLGDHQLWETSERRSHFTDYTMNNRLLDAIASQEYWLSVNQFLSQVSIRVSQKKIGFRNVAEFYLI